MLPAAQLVQRAANRLKRELYRLPGVRAIRGYEYLEALEAHSLHLPALDPVDLPLLAGLRARGVLSVPVESMKLDGTSAMLAACKTLVEELETQPTQGGNAPRLPIDRVMELPEIYLWGLTPRLLDLIENYVGLPIRYHGADFRREVADGKLTDVRHWHVDAEDRRMFKIILYLNDVVPGGGPFQYMPRPLTIDTVRRLRYSSGFVTDDVMRRVVPEGDWTEALGPKHTANLADTCKVFHRAQPPRTQDRYSVTFSWTSTTAVKSYPSMPLGEKAWSTILSRTSPRQQSVLPART